MSLSRAMAIGATGLAAQRSRMELVSSTWPTPARRGPPRAVPTAASSPYSRPSR